MLRMVNQMVDAYLDLRRELTQSLDHWQSQLLSQTKRFGDWDTLLSARMRLHHLDDICEDQRAAVQEWLDELDTWTSSASPADLLREVDLLKVQSKVIYLVWDLPFLLNLKFFCCFLNDSVLVKQIDAVQQLRIITF